MALTGQRVIHDLRAALFAHLLKLEAGFFDRTPVGRLMTRVLSDVEAVSEAFTSGVFADRRRRGHAGRRGRHHAVDGLAPGAGHLRDRARAVRRWPATCGIRARDAYREVRRRLARLNAFLQESHPGHGGHPALRRARRTSGDSSSDSTRTIAARSSARTAFEASLYATVEALGSLALALLLWYGGGAILAGALTFGGLVAFIQYTNRFFLPIRDLGAKYTVMQAAMAVGRAHLRPARPRARRSYRRAAPRGVRRGRRRARRLRERVVRVRRTSDGCWPTAASPSRRASTWRWSAPPARASRPACAC